MFYMTYLFAIIRPNIYVKFERNRWFELVSNGLTLKQIDIDFFMNFRFSFTEKENFMCSS